MRVSSPQAIGPTLALASAALFGLTPALLKPVASSGSALALGGILYLGCGLGLLPGALFARGSLEALCRLSLSARVKLGAAVLAGGVLAPALLVAAVRRGTAFEVSALLNLECVATALIARLLFREHVGARVWAALALLCAGGALMGWRPGATGLSSAALLVLGACMLWGLDNNLTRELEELPPALLAGLKGFVAGGFNLALAWAFAPVFPSAAQATWVLLVGAFGFGLSLTLFVRALRLLGSARAGAYFAAAPFIGMFASTFLLAEAPAAAQAAAALLMGAGILVLHGERHAHAHAHEPQEHAHPHGHDEHHAGHRHEGEILEGHEHPHVHASLRHSHAHWPDLHHRGHHDGGSSLG